MDSPSPTHRATATRSRADALVASGFEHYMLTDESRSHPMVSYLEVGLAGPVDLDCLAAALPAAYARHPLMAARIVPRWGRSPLWEGVATLPPLAVVTDPNRHLVPQGDEFLDLTASPGCRAAIETRGETSRILLFVHHACADALGMVAFVVDWLNAYGRAKGSGGDVPPELPPPDLERLRSRADITGVRSPHSFAERMEKVRNILHKARPKPLAGAGANPVPVTPPGHCIRTLTAEEFQELQARSRAVGMTINDRLACAMLRTVLRWQEEHGPVDPRDLYRLIIPISRRTAEDRDLPACNKISYKFLARTAEAIRWPDLDVKVHEELDFLRRHRLQIVNVLKMINRFQRLRLTRWLLPPTKCFATAVLSNIGDVASVFSDRLPTREGVWETAGVRVTSLACAPPRRPLTHNTVVAIGYGGTLTLSSRGDGRGLPYAATERFLEMLTGELVGGS